MTEEIDNIIDNFDFEAVEKVMIALGWYWHIDFANETRRPTIDEMKVKARHLLNMAATHHITTGTGGFEAGNHGDRLYLKFVAVEW